MANLTPTPGWDNIPQLELTTRAVGGAGGTMNAQAQALLNRIAQLKDELDAIAAGGGGGGGGGDVASVNGKTGVVVLNKTDIGLANVDNTADTAKPISTATSTALGLKAPLESPTFTGIPVVPTATAGTNTTQVASTAFVATALSGKADSSALSSKANLDSPALSGTPTAPTAAAGTSSTQLATTAFVQQEKSIPQNSQSAAYTLLLTDANKHLYHPSTDTTARTWTIPANASVSFPIGTTLTFVNDNSAGVITIAITSDTLVLAGVGTTGSRTLAANGIATALKVAATRWQINGTGLS